MARMNLDSLHKVADEMLVTGRVPSSSAEFRQSLSRDEPQEGLVTSAMESLGTSAPDLVDSVINRAIARGASDIHIEPSRESTQVRFRIDGQLQHALEIPAGVSLEFVSRLKVMCNMDIAEKRRPQDGRFHFNHQAKSVDVRVSTIPTESGEKMVLRLLDQAGSSLDLEQLGIPIRNLEVLRAAIDRPQGMVLVTGPTGSGKTTTLYACLRQIRSPKLNILTIEDPIEYRLDGINQSQVKPDIGYDFAKALRAFLRQDPNVIMVGEIRDAETAQIALRAAMTGHLVLSTVHTNDSVATVSRLLDLGAEPYLIASSLSLIVAQRLVRRLCHECRHPAGEGSAGACVAVGCLACDQTGYKGRVGVFEVLPIDPTIQAMIHSRAPAEQIRAKARASGLRVLAESARDKWLNGETTLEEIEREIGAVREP